MPINKSSSTSQLSEQQKSYSIQLVHHTHSSPVDPSQWPGWRIIMAATWSAHIFLDGSPKLLSELMEPFLCQNHMCQRCCWHSVLSWTPPPRCEAFHHEAHTSSRTNDPIPHAFWNISFEWCWHWATPVWNVLSANALCWVSKSYLRYRTLSCKWHFNTHPFLHSVRFKSSNKKKYLPKNYIKTSKTNIAYDLIKA